MREREEFDTQLATLGKGVMAMFERYCNRRFAWLETDTATFNADNLVCSLPRYPVTALDTVRLQGEEVTFITETVARTDAEAGLVHFHSAPGGLDERILISYSGGWWWDTTEDASGEMPAGATALPEDLQTAFFTQMAALVEARDLFGLQSADDKAKPPKRLDMGLLPTVQTILNPHRRFAAA